MQRFIVISLVSLWGLVGCGGQDSTPSPAVAESAAASSGEAKGGSVKPPSTAVESKPTPDSSIDEDVSAESTTQPSAVVWAALESQGFERLTFGENMEDYASEQMRELLSHEISRTDEGIELRLKAGPKGESPSLGAVRFDVTRIKGFAIELDLSAPAANDLNFVSILATNRRGGRMGRWRWKLPPVKERRKNPRQVASLVIDGDLGPFRQVSDEASFQGAFQIHMQVQIKPESEAKLTVLGVGVLPNNSTATDQMTITQKREPKPDPSLSVKPVTSFMEPSTVSRSEAMAASMLAIQERLDTHGSSWENWFEELAPQRAELKKKLAVSAVTPLRLDNGTTMRRLTPVTHRPGDDWPGPQLRMLSSLDQQLSDRGIQLILVPIPNSEQVFADKFLGTPPADGVMDVYREFLLHSLLRQDLEVVDVRPALRAVPNDAGLLFYEGKQSGLADAGIQVVAQEVARRLGRYGFETTAGELGTATVEFKVPEKMRESAPNVNWADTYVATKVVRLNGADLAVAPVESPVLVITDRALGLPKQYGVSSADVISHVIKESGVLVDRATVGMAVGKTLKLLSQSDPSLLKNRKVCILVFGENALYQNGPEESKRWDVVELDAGTDGAN